MWSVRKVFVKISAMYHYFDNNDLKLPKIDFLTLKKFEILKKIKISFSVFGQKKKIRI